VHRMQTHFSTVAAVYRDLRVTDPAPIAHIAQALSGCGRVRAADVGCGTGRYDLELYRRFDAPMSLICIDLNEEMLRELTTYLEAGGVLDFAALRAAAENLPLADSSVDCVFALNAIHHFDVGRALEESTRILGHGGWLFIYTRLRSQNCKNIWGRFFPGFTLKETRLYELSELRSAVSSTSGLQVTSVERFRYDRTTSLAELMRRAERRHYSTFALYNDDEFRRCLRRFRERLLQQFPDPSNITWWDEYILLVGRNTRH
jgi:ubiquinone/menaquinone biosynthesis C-methylase UbiE